MNKSTTLLFLVLSLAINKGFSQDYFPMEKGSYWIYNAYDDGNLSYVDSTIYNTEIVINDTNFHLFVHYYLIPGASASVDTFFLFENYTDKNTIMLSNRNMDVIDSAVFAKHSYTDGEWWIAHKIPEDDTITVESIGDITVTAGTFSNCFFKGEEYYFAPDIGIIKIILQNATSYYDLIRYSIPHTIAVGLNNCETLKLHPNPVKDFIYTNITDNSDYSIIAIDGQVIQSGQIVGKQIPASELAMGMYVILVKSGAETYITKFIKE